MVPDAVVVKKLFDTIAARFGERHGGYTRILRAGTRPGDRAPMVVLELVDRPEVIKEKSKTDAKAEKAPRGEKKDKGEAAAARRQGQEEEGRRRGQLDTGTIGDDNGGPRRPPVFFCPIRRAIQVLPEELRRPLPGVVRVGLVVRRLVRVVEERVIPARIDVDLRPTCPPS